MKNTRIKKTGTSVPQDPRGPRAPRAPFTPGSIRITSPVAERLTKVRHSTPKEPVRYLTVIFAILMLLGIGATPLLAADLPIPDDVSFERAVEYANPAG